MAAKRTRTSDRKREVAERERIRAETEFRESLAAVASVADADRLAIEPRGHRTRDRHLYANFSFFWSQRFAIPAAASAWELHLYIDLLRRLDAAGALNPGALREHARRIELTAPTRT